MEEVLEKQIRKSPFKGDLEGPGDLESLSPKSPFKGDLEGLVPNAPKWQVADPLAYTILKENSKNNRRNLTTAETVFWKIAKGRVYPFACLFSLV